MFKIQSFADTMTRTRFEKINKYFHINDVTANPARGEPGHDRLIRARRVIDHVNEACLENYMPHKESSIDEAMIAYKGRLSFKQYLPAKPTKFGVKVWVRADPNNGYVNVFNFHYNLPKESTVGGIGIFIRDSINYNISHGLNIESTHTNLVENLWLDFQKSA